MKDKQPTRLELAIEMALQAHRGQTYDHGEPYILHPLDVMLRVRAAGGDENTQCAAVLHDTVEDTNLTVSEIHDKLGIGVAQTVWHLTRKKGQTYEAYIHEVKTNAYNRHTVFIKLFGDLASNIALAKVHPIPGPRGTKLAIRYARTYSDLWYVWQTKFAFVHTVQHPENSPASL